MYRSHNCGELRISDLEQEVSLSGWVQKVRDKGFFIWIDLRDRYGITQLILDKDRSSNEIFDLGKTIGREYVIHVKGSVIKRSSKNPKIKTGEILYIFTTNRFVGKRLTFKI